MVTIISNFQVDKVWMCSVFLPYYFSPDCSFIGVGAPVSVLPKLKPVPFYRQVYNIWQPSQQLGACVPFAQNNLNTGTSISGLFLSVEGRKCPSAPCVFSHGHFDIGVVVLWTLRIVFTGLWLKVLFSGSPMVQFSLVCSLVLRDYSDDVGELWD